MNSLKHLQTNGAFLGAMLAIQPKYVERILDGSKGFEFRKLAPQQQPTHLVLYASSPVKRIVGLAVVSRIVVLPPNKLWKATRSRAGVSKGFFDDYFKEQSLGVAYELGELVVLPAPTPPEGVFDNWSAPQGLRYVDKSFLTALLAAVEAAQ